MNHPKNITFQLDKFLQHLSQFPTHYLEYSAKREKAMNEACKDHDVVYNITAVLNPLNSSYLLGMNDVVVKPFVHECGQLLAAIEFSEKLVKQTSKQCKEVTDYYTNLFNMIGERKDFVTWMFNDVQYWADTYQFTYDKTELIELFKKSKQDHLKFLDVIQKNKRRVSV